MLHWRPRLYAGIDYHRKYSVLRMLDVHGNRVKSARIDHNEAEAFVSYFAALPKKSRVVEASVLFFTAIRRAASSPPTDGKSS